jgi:hypothetical protein
MSVLFWQSIIAQTTSGSINGTHQVEDPQMIPSTPPSLVSTSFPAQRIPSASRNLGSFRSGTVQIAVSIIESESYNSAQVMDTMWAFAARSLGYVPTIRPQTALDDTAFFSQTNLLIISSGVIGLPANRAKTILQFIKSGKPVYLQGEYLPTYSTNMYFDALVDSLGGAFTPGGTVSGDLAPMSVTGTLSTTPNPIDSLAYFWYGCSGTGDGLTCIPFLSYQNNNFGFIFTPPNPARGKVIMTTDQDWVWNWSLSGGLPLIENILAYLSNATQGTAPVITVSPSSFDVSLQQGDSTTRTLTIGNLGTADLKWHFSNLSQTLSVNQAEAQIQGVKSAAEVRRLEERKAEKQKLIELKNGSTTELSTQTVSMQQSVRRTPSSAPGTLTTLFPNAQFFAQFPDYSGNIHPMGIAFDGTYYWVVGGGTSSGDVAQLNKDFSLVITKNVNLDCRSIFYNRADGNVYIKDWSSNSLYRLHTAPFDGTIDLVLSNIFQNSQTKVVITEDGQFLYDQLGGNVRKYRFSDGAVVSTFTLALQHTLDWPRENLLALSGSYLLTVAGDTVYAYDTTSGAFLSSSSLPSSSWSEWSMSYSSGLFFITNTGEDTWFAYRIDNGSQLGWMTANPDSGLISPGSNQNVIIKFITKNLTPGNYSDTIRIVSNDAINNPKKVPATLTVQGPTITSVVPDSAAQGQTLAVTITGQNTNFRVTQGSVTYDANHVWFSQGSSTINTSSVSVSSATGLTANFTIPNSAPTGLWNVNVEQPLSMGIVTLNNGFTVNVGGSPIPTPRILSVRDVPNDNGRQVFVRWKVDQPAVSSGIARFGIWRKDSVWTFLKDSVLTVNDTVYQFVAPTIYDSTKVSGMWYSVFRISAHNVNPAIFTMSQPDSGYSLDNLVPSVPKGVKGSVESGGTIAFLQWNKVPEKDLRYYAVYRSETAGFTQVDSTTFVGASADTTYRDTTVVYGQKYYYRIVAFDWSGNRSDPSDQFTISILSVARYGTEIPKEFSLAQNYPNPFNPSTIIRYGVPTRSQVKVDIYNSIGQRVATLLDDERDAGYYEVEWRAAVASGIYIYRIEAIASDNPNNAFVQVKKMVLVR